MDHEFATIPSLSEDLLRMLLDPAFSDMVFVCSDGQEVPASRMLVAARSSVLHSMLLTSGMSESRLASVHLECIRGSAMRICVEFLYTNHVQDISLQPMALDEIMEAVIATARFFLVPGLERCCIDYCTHALDDLSSRPRPIEELLRAYNLGVQLYHDHPEKNMIDLLHKFGEFFETALNEELESYQLLSEQGCLHLLENLKPSMALREYHLLVHAIRWCASTSILMSQNVEVQKLLDELLPSSETRILAVLEEGQPTHVDNVKLIKLLADPLGSLLHKSSLDLSKIPSTILSRILEPLDIIPCSKLLAAYRIHALHPPDLRWDAWCLHEKYSISPSDPTEIRCATAGPDYKGFAKCSTCVMASHYLFFEWEVTILEACSQEACIGFCLASPSQARSSIAGILGREEGTVGFAIDGDLLHNGNVISEASASYQRGRRMFYDEFDDQQIIEDFIGTRFGVHIQLQTGVCSFKINGRKIVETCEIAVIDKGVYPAIALGAALKASIRVVSYA